MTSDVKAESKPATRRRCPHCGLAMDTMVLLTLFKERSLKLATAREISIWQHARFALKDKRAVIRVIKSLAANGYGKSWQSKDREWHLELNGFVDKTLMRFDTGSALGVIAYPTFLPEDLN